VPVWNGLTDAWNPTQMLADVLTVTDHCAKLLSEVSLCYLGDGRNNTANSPLVTGGLLGMDLRICAPPGLRPAQAVQLAAGRLVRRSGARLTVTSDVRSAVAGVDFLYTDAWPSMGEPAVDWDARIDQLLPYQVNSAVLAATGNPPSWSQRSGARDDGDQQRVGLPATWPVRDAVRDHGPKNLSCSRFSVELSFSKLSQINVST
jgi:ornithine carbamoyltransferase